MTGIERLRGVVRELGRFSFCYDLYMQLSDIADQIESERACDSDTATEQKAERLGHLVWRLQNRLARSHRREKQLRKGMRMWREKAIDKPQVSVSAYDLLPEEDREALRWVHGHGGLDEVRRDYQDAYNRCVELCAALGIDTNASWSDAMAEMVKRLMPDGMEWPMYESGEPVRIGDVVSDVEVRSVVFRDGGILLSDCTSVPGWGTWRSYKEPIKRPAKVLDADGVEIREGETVWRVDTGVEYWVKSGLTITADAVVIIRKTDCDCESEIVKASQLTHRAPVLAADGRPLREGETVWDVWDMLGNHERPDSWERIEEDAGCTATKYNERRGTIFTTKQQVARDLVRRAKALAERERGER